MMLLILILIAIVVALVLVYVAIMAATRRVVPPNCVDVVVDINGKKMFSSDTTHNTQGETVYHEFPQWVPLWGKTVTRVPLEILKASIDNLTLFDNQRARFDCDLAVYIIVEDPIKASIRMPATIEDMQVQLKNILQSTARGASTQKPMVEIITNRAELVSTLTSEVSNIVTNWGLHLNNIELLRFHDSPDTENVTNLALREEKKIEKDTRIEVAENEKLAVLAEAKAQEDAEKRVIEMEKVVNISEQEKEKAIFQKEKEAQEQRLEVEKVEMVKHEQNIKDARKLEGEGEKVYAEGRAEADALPIRRTGEAKADVHRLKLFAEANGKEKIKDVVNEFTELGVQAMVAQEVIEKDRQVDIATAGALSNADIRVLAGGADQNGFSLAKLLQSIKVGDREGAKALLNRIARPNDLGFSSIDELLNAIDNPKTVSKIKRVLKQEGGQTK